MRSATDILRDEHQLILHALLNLEHAAVRLGAGGRLPEDLWTRTICWFRAFADRSHHAKEETALFPAMVKGGVPSEGGPIAVMLQEHAEGRALLATMYTGEPVDQAAAAHRYIRLLRDHIDKENEILFPLADAVLDERDQTEVSRQFADLETQLGQTACLDHARDALARL
ncbi:MAG TPA: hemerythrin domain-containing protein [Methylomirabilota bacterium]